MLPLRNRKKYGTDIDYNEDIVYEQAPMPGIYDTSTEDRQIKRSLSSLREKSTEKVWMVIRISQVKKIRTKKKT